jgi:uncharacterized protein YbaP (TraB family)
MNEGKRVESFETAATVFVALDAVPKEELLSMLMNSAEEQGRDVKELNGCVAAWNAGDTAALERIIRENETLAPRFIKALLDDRNAGMAKRIGELCAKRDDALFVCVGAGHIVGRNGLVALLEKAGFKLTQAKRLGKGPAAKDDTL